MIWNVSWGSLRYLSPSTLYCTPTGMSRPTQCLGWAWLCTGIIKELYIIRSGWMTPLTHKMNMVLVPEQDQVATVEESWPASNEDETAQASSSLVPWELWCQERGGTYAPNRKFSCLPPITFMGGNMTVLRGHPGILRVNLLVLQEWYATPLWLSLTLPAADPHWSS